MPAAGPAPPLTPNWRQKVAPAAQIRFAVLLAIPYVEDNMLRLLEQVLMTSRLGEGEGADDARQRNGDRRDGSRLFLGSRGWDRGAVPPTGRTGFATQATCGRSKRGPPATGLCSFPHGHSTIVSRPELARVGGWCPQLALPPLSPLAWPPAGGKKFRLQRKRKRCIFRRPGGGRGNKQDDHITPCSLPPRTPRTGRAS